MGGIGCWVCHLGCMPGTTYPNSTTHVIYGAANTSCQCDHIDVVNMRSEHEVKVDNDSKVIKIKPTMTSNKLELTNEFPKNFETFKYAEKR